MLPTQLLVARAYAIQPISDVLYLSHIGRDNHGIAYVPYIIVSGAATIAIVLELFYVLVYKEDHRR